MAPKDENKAKEKLDAEVITAIYKVNLHCPQCARDIKTPLMRTQGVHKVEVDIEKAEIKVKGVIDVIKIHKQIEKLSKKKVELVSPQVKIKDISATEKKVADETKEEILRATTVKIHMHCDKCENDLRNRLLKHKGIFSVTTDIQTQTLTVEGTIESDKLLAYIRKKIHKHAEIKEEKKMEQKKGKEENKENPKVEAQAIKSVQVAEFEAEKQVEAKAKDGNVPYFIHYVHAPQLFSDENPNACFIM